MYSFAYHRPDTLQDASSKLAGCEDGKLIAGGQTLLPTLKQRLAQPSDLVDLSAIADLAGIAENGDRITIGSMTRHVDVAQSEIVRKRIPALADLASHIGDAQVRNLGTLGGSIANNDPAADYPAALQALQAEVKTDKAVIGKDAFFKGMFETALGESDIIVSVSFLVPERAAYVKFPNPASRYAIVGVFVAKFSDQVRVAVTGAGPCVFRLSEVEAALSQNFSPDAIPDPLDLHGQEMNSDIHASAEYRAHLVKVMARRAVAACA